MARDTSSVRELSYGAVEVYSEETLGVGSYGKVCKAKCGQLPCAAKLLHDTMFGTNDPGTNKFIEQFEQECQFLRMVKHPNIVQFLGTVIDPRSQRLALLMELMDESLTKFLERSTGPLPYHTQLNICHDVALALAYLQSNDIIHRDLSSNNVLLIGEGSRAKVTDFGMSKLIGMSPRMTPLTLCPGTQAYMPPEALIQPPRYSDKLDCFSHGLLTIQIATRNYPNPGNAYIEDPDEDLLRRVPEAERRKEDINLVDPNHPLLSIALKCLSTKAKDRPSADELCGRLATLKSEQMYTRSVEQSREQSASVQTSQIQEKERERERARANQESELCKQLSSQLLEKGKELEKTKQQLEDKDKELQTAKRQARENQHELTKVRSEYEDRLRDKESLLEQVVNDSDAVLQAKVAECERNQSLIEQLRDENRELLRKQEKRQVSKAEPKLKHFPTQTRTVVTTPAKLAWKQAAPAPENLSTYWGSAVAHGNTAYFSMGYNIHSYTASTNRWTTLDSSEYRAFGLAVVNDKLTTIGGLDQTNATSILVSFSWGLLGKRWKQSLPPMPTPRVRPAAITTPTHLIVAGGRAKLYGNGMYVVEILDLHTQQWIAASSSPFRLHCPNMVLSGQNLYLSEDKMMFFCSVGELLRSCNPVPSASNTVVWTRTKDIPVPYWASLTSLGGHVLAIGGKDKDVNPLRAVHQYDVSTNTWSMIGVMPTCRAEALVAVIPSNELIVAGGSVKGTGKECKCNITEIATLV